MAFRATAYQKRLQEAGFSDKQTQVLTESMEDFVLGEVVTKDFLEAKLGELELRLIRWMVGMGGATLLAVLVALFRGALAGSP